MILVDKGFNIFDKFLNGVILNILFFFISKLYFIKEEV